jgi:hypothetical protein
MKRIFSEIFSNPFLFALLFPLLVTGQITEKNFHKTISAAGAGKLSITHQRGPLVIEKSMDSQIHADLLVRIKGKNEEDVNQLLESIELKESRVGPGIELVTQTQISSWINALGVTRVKLKSGAVIHNIQELEMILTVKVPAITQLHLNNKYENIEIQSDLQSHVSVDLYSGEFLSKNIEGDLTIRAKYSDLHFADFKQGIFDLYECKVTGGQGTDLNIQSKYSNIKLQTFDMLNVTSYEDHYTLGDIRQQVVISDKYSEFYLGNIGNARLNLYETNLELKHGKGLVIDCKYGTIHAGNLTRIELNESYEADLIIESLDELLVRNDKYGKYEIGSLRKSLRLKGYETSLDVKQVSPQLSEVSIDSKYDRMRLGFPPELRYVLDAELKYGSLTYHDGIFTSIDRKEKGEELIVKADLNDQMKPKVIIRSYETDIVLE